MNKKLTYLILFALLLSFGSSISQARGGVNDNPSTANTPGAGMPSRPIPARPIPHHDPGRPSKATLFTSQVNQVNGEGVEQTITLTGLDAMLNEGIIADPLAGNYRLVNMDKIFFSSFINSDTFGLQTFDITPTLATIPGSDFSLGDYGFNDIAAGDLNGDGQAEQIAAWIGSNNHIYMNTGEIPSLETKVTSAPAALAQSDGTGHLVVRGYDDALWHSRYDGSTWSIWSNAGGGFLLSAPAIVSQGAGQFDVFAIGADNLTYQRHWAGGVFTGTWQFVDVPGYWPEIEGTAPTPELDAPSVVARSAGRLDLFRRGPDNTLRWRHFDGTAWGAWEDKGGILTSAPAAISYGADGFLVIGRGVDGALWYRIYASGSWGRWERLAMPAGITAASAPSLASTQAGQINLYLCGSDDALWQNQYAGGIWGSWGSGGGVLGSGVGAAVWNSQVDLFAQKTDGRLQHSSGSSTWTDWINPPARTTYDTGAVAVPPGGDDAFDNLLIDIDTGYFTGDGRQQILLAYQAPGDQIKIELYDAPNGMTLLADLSTPITGKAPRIAATDVDGDGVDDIVVAYVLPSNVEYKIRAYHVEKDGGGHWTGNLVAGKSSSTISTYGAFYFGDTLRIEAGDLDGDGKDEAAVLSDWWNTQPGYDFGVWFHLYTFDNDTVTDVGVCNPLSNSNCQLADQKYVESDDQNYCDQPVCPYFIGAGLAVGDMNADSRDEVVVTWPDYFDGYDMPNLVRRLRILDASAITTTTSLAEWAIPGYASWSFLDTLAVGDLDRDLKDEIVFYTYNSLSVYEYNQNTITQIKSIGLSNPSSIRSVKVVTGDFTGESLRLGQPTYRLQRSTGDIIAILNQPPKHIDTLNGTVYDINSTDTGTYAAYENDQSQSTEMSIQVERDWAFADGLETTIGDPEGTHVKTSLDTTYGAHFENSTTAFTQLAFGSEVKATSDDIVYYTGKDLQVWEYPVYEDDSRVPTGRILVTFPLPGVSNTGTQEYYETGNSTCDFWYAPEHQINNVWSYAKDASQLKDFDPAKGILNTLQTVTVGPLEGEFWTSWQNIATTKWASSINQSVETMFEGQIGGDSFEVSAQPLGVGVAYEVHLPSVKGTLKNSYSNDVLSTHTVIGSNTTTVRVHFNPIAVTGIYNYEVTPYLYWAKVGYLVLDYLTAPKSTTFWNQYNQPDPAFILPWTGGQCAGKELFSKDITASPPFASNGETVIIAATVHNFSNVGVTNVRVRFYLGEPGLNIQIGSDQLINLPARGKVDVSVPWQASGIGEQRIYAVIDPNHALTEMHDETTNPASNNNIAFGVVAMGDAGFVDPGAQAYFDYQYLTYTNTQSLSTNIFIPTEAMSETLRIEITPLSPSFNIRQGFSLDAYKGGSDRETPWMINFDSIPAAIWLRYSDDDVIGLDEHTLILYRYDSDQKGWVDAACGEYQRYPDENWMLVPVCKTGDFALLTSYMELFLPILLR